MPGRLTIKGGFRVNGDRDRYLQKQARRLGFAGLHACLQALLDDGWSVPQLAAHLAATQAAIRHAIADHHLPQPPRRQRLVRQRQHAADQRAATRAAELGRRSCAVQQRRQVRLAELGFATPEEYLQDRCVGRGWSVRRLGAELGVGHGWLDQQLRRLGLRG